MNAPKPGPLDVRCPWCFVPKGEPCAKCFNHKCPCQRVKFHAVRIRAAQKAREEKTK